MLKTVKLRALSLAKVAGLYNLVASSNWRGRRLLILCYHGVSIDDEHEWNPSLFMSPVVFESRMKRLKDFGCNVLPLGEGISRLYTGDLPEKSVAITVDDGMFNFCSRALPILKRYGLPATVYLTTFYSQVQLPIFRLACSYMLWKKRGGRFRALESHNRTVSIDTRTPENRMLVVMQLDRIAKDNKLSAEEKGALAAQLAQILEFDYEQLGANRLFNVLTPDEVRELSSDVDFQLHTHRHRTPSNRELFFREIDDNSEIISKAAQHLPKHFCYPSGVHREEYLPWLKEKKIASATTCIPGISGKRHDPLLLPRLVDHMNLTEVEFEGWLTGVSVFLPRRKSQFTDPNL